MAGSIGVLIVVDEPFLRDSITLALRAEDVKLRVCESTRSVDEMLAGFEPTIAIVDLGLHRLRRPGSASGPDGFALTLALRAASDLSVIVVGGAHRVEDRLDAFSAGAEDFLVRPFSSSELRARVAVAVARASERTQRFLDVGAIFIDRSAHLVHVNGEPIGLRNTEYRLLELFCRHPGQVLSKAQILEKVWGPHVSDVNLVEVHVSHLRRAMERCGPRMIHTIRGAGYVLEPVRLPDAATSRASGREVLDLRHRQPGAAAPGAAADGAAGDGAAGDGAADAGERVARRGPPPRSPAVASSEPGEA